MGESYGCIRMGNDEAIMPYITSCNIACGMHGGDPITIAKTVECAIKHKVRIGAHPSFPDLAGFGRKMMDIPYRELKPIIAYQINNVKRITESNGDKLWYVKPHGALYNSLTKNENNQRAVIDAIQEIDENLYLMGLAHIPLADKAKESGLKYIHEAFADRSYTNDGTLVNRKDKNAVITDPTLAASQVVNIVVNKSVKSVDQKKLIIEAQSICIHGDNKYALPILKEIEHQFQQHRIIKKSFIES